MLFQPPCAVNIHDLKTRADLAEDVARIAVLTEIVAALELDLQELNEQLGSRGGP